MASPLAWISRSSTSTPSAIVSGRSSVSTRCQRAAAVVKMFFCVSVNPPVKSSVIWNPGLAELPDAVPPPPPEVGLSSTGAVRSSCSMPMTDPSGRSTVVDISTRRSTASIISRRPTNFRLRGCERFMASPGHRAVRTRARAARVRPTPMETRKSSVLRHGRNLFLRKVVRKPYGVWDCRRRLTTAASSASDGLSLAPRSVARFSHAAAASRWFSSSASCANRSCHAAVASSMYDPTGRHSVGVAVPAAAAARASSSRSRTHYG